MLLRVLTIVKVVPDPDASLDDVCDEIRVRVGDALLETGVVEHMDVFELAEPAVDPPIPEDDDHVMRGYIPRIPQMFSARDDVRAHVEDVDLIAQALELSNDDK